jgi:hypothetical protein
MSEEFYMNVSFELPDTSRMKQLEILIEHLDLSETDAARALLSGYNLASAQAMIDELTTGYSDYSSDEDLVQMYLDTYNDSVDDMELKLDQSTCKGEISVEGYDREADDFCAALVLILVAIGATGINAKAGSAMWNASWIQSESGEIQLDFEAEE